MRGDAPRDPTMLPEPLRTSLVDLLGSDRVLTRPIDLAAFASDASVYRMVPCAVVRPATAGQVRALFGLCRTHRVPLTFRTAGTSLSGQAVTDGILVDLSRDWRGVEVLDGGRRVRAQPGAVGAAVNARLRPFGAKIGPDPASIQACMMGGILANNSSGMCCGVALNAYHTVDSLVLLLPSGTLLDTSRPDADDELASREPALHAGLSALRREVEGDDALRERIRARYLGKNTTGYSLNAFVDFERPIDILRNLAIGSEGTLAFIASATLRTVPDRPVKYAGLLLFPGIAAACDAIVPLRDAGAAALEVMDRAALRSVERQDGIPPEIRELPDGAAGLLVEFQAEAEADRPAMAVRAAHAVARLDLLAPPRFSHDAVEQAALWKVRQGMYPSVGAARQRGTAAIIEDVAFPVERLADAVVDLRALLDRHGYDDAIVFGHAKDGNLHFVLCQSFNDEAQVARYARFMDDMVRLVVGKYDGALKAEHGTGRNMAPFVETEWGAEAYSVMRRVKALADPEGVLNPGVLISTDPRAHLAHLKTLPEVDDEIDKCIECGYCESRCPSRDLTLTPRQRIVLRRELARLALGAPGPASTAIEVDLPYAALDTCAVDGLCATACPVSIDTGQLTKRLRASRHGAFARWAAGWVARNFGLVEWAVRNGLRAAGALSSIGGGPVIAGLSCLPRLAGLGTPAWLAPMPGPAAPIRPGRPTAASAVYFPSCLSRTMGHLPGEPRELSLADALVRLAARAGQPVLVPPGAAGHCCGVPFSSKGYADAHAAAVNRTIESFWTWSEEGRLPIVVDTSPCTYGLKTCRTALTAANQGRFDRLTILDGLQFVSERLLPRLEIVRRRATVVLHPVCSVVKMNLTPALERVAGACADRVVVPLDAGCCGFAGDRGWLVPELTASATAREAAEAAEAPADGWYSSSRTCEIGMARATGKVYRSYLYLIEWATRPATSAPGRPS
jgi:D-lactate dehydrogenase